MVRAESM